MINLDKQLLQFIFECFWTKSSFSKAQSSYNNKNKKLLIIKQIIVS